VGHVDPNTFHINNDEVCARVNFPYAQVYCSYIKVLFLYFVLATNLFVDLFALLVVFC